MIGSCHYGSHRSHYEILGSEHCRQWIDAQKRKIIEEIRVDGAIVAEVARYHELTRQHLY